MENLPLACVHPSLTNPRKRFDEAELNELAESIKQHGVMQPILVRPINKEEVLANKAVHHEYEIVAGERRYRASKIAEQEKIPAIIRDLDDITALQLQILENLQRSDLHPLEEANGFKALLANTSAKSWTIDQLAEKVGKSRSYIYASLKLTELCTYAQDAFYDGKLKRETAILIARIPGEKLQTLATKEITAEDYAGKTMSYRAACKHLQQRYMLQLDKAIFDTHSTSLFESAGSCFSCPKRSGNNPELFSDVESADVCTDPDCFAWKKAAHVVLIEASGKKVIKGEEAKNIAPHGVEYYVTNGYVRANSEPHGFDESYKDLLGDDMPEPTLLVDKENNVAEVYLESDLEQKLQAKIDSGELVVPESAPEEKSAWQIKREQIAALKAVEEARRLEKWKALATAIDGDKGKLNAFIVRQLLALIIPDAANTHINELYQHTNSETDYIVEAIRGESSDLNHLLKLCGLALASQALEIGWGWESVDDNTDDDEYNLFAAMCRAYEVDPDPDLTPTEPAPTPPIAAQAPEEVATETSEAGEPAAQAVEAKPLPPKLQAIKDKALAKKAKKQAQEESANADDQSQASTAAAAEETNEEASA